MTERTKFALAGTESRSGLQAAQQPRYQVICVLGGSGFPFGIADPSRPINVGKALLSVGIGFRVIHSGPNPIGENTSVEGVYEGIPYEYTTLTVKRPRSFLPLMLLKVWGLAVLTIRLLQLWPERRRTCVYIYVQSGIIGLTTAVVCRVIGVPVAQEINEWWPETAGCSRFTKWLYKRPMFSLATGTLVISTLIEERVRAAEARLKHSLILHRMPIIVELAKFKTYDQQPSLAETSKNLPHFVWCGGVASYIEDVFFTIRTLAQVKQQGLASQLVIVGAVDQILRQRILEYAKTQGVGGMVKLTGYIGDDDLQALYSSAAGLLVPLRNDDRSRTRFPTKLGGYLASGAPVITCDVGDLRLFLEHGKSAYIGPPGDEQHFADNMCSVLRDRSRARVVGAAGRRVCQTEFDYPGHARDLASFFMSCIGREAH